MWERACVYPNFSAPQEYAQFVLGIDRASTSQFDAVWLSS